MGERAQEAWNHIEHLLTEECGLRLDEGLEGQRANCVNAIANAIVDPALMRAAVEFLRCGGLHKLRVHGEWMTALDVANAIQAANGEDAAGGQK